MEHCFTYKVTFTKQDGEHETDTIDVVVNSDDNYIPEEIELNAWNIADSKAQLDCDKSDFANYDLQLVEAG